MSNAIGCEKRTAREQLWRGNLFVFGFLGHAAVLLIKAFDPARGVDKLLLSGIERMAGRANLDLVGTPGGIRIHHIAASTLNLAWLIVGVNCFLHDKNLQARSYSAVGGARQDGQRPY